MLQVVNLYGISFVDDSHIESLSSNCIHMEVLAVNFCLRVKGASLKILVQRCKKLKTLLMQHCGMLLIAESPTIVLESKRELNLNL